MFSRLLADDTPELKASAAVERSGAEHAALSAIQHLMLPKRHDPVLTAIGRFNPANANGPGGDLVCGLTHRVVGQPCACALYGCLAVEELDWIAQSRKIGRRPIYAVSSTRWQDVGRQRAISHQEAVDETLDFQVTPPSVLRAWQGRKGCS